MYPVVVPAMPQHHAMLPRNLLCMAVTRGKRFPVLVGQRTPGEGAAIGVRLATLPGDGPNGGFFDDAGAVAW